MAQNPLLIIHGWSDSSTSFTPLVNLLQSQLKRDIHLFDLADYLSLDDDLTFDDIVTAMSHAWEKNKLPMHPFSIDVIAHSTGGVIVRDWLSRNFTPATAPIKHLVMLAPANFGSPLAHKGQAFIGRIINGFSGDKLFQVGTKILQGLELASPYTWNLAMADRFGAEDFYGQGKILCTVLVGNKGYTGISAAANENGTDGVVRLATANMNCALLEADFSQNPLQPTYQYIPSLGLTAFGIMDKENHSSIAAKKSMPQNPLTISTIVGGLTVDDAHFATWCASLNEMNSNTVQQGLTEPYTQPYQSSTFLVQNQYGEDITDYFLEFYATDDEQAKFAETFHANVISTAHAYSQNNSYRNLHLNYLQLKQLIQSHQHMCVSLTALPEFTKNGNVGYRTFSDQDIGAIYFNQKQLEQLFIPNQTLLIRITLQRLQAERVFEIHSA